MNHGSNVILVAVHMLPLRLTTNTDTDICLVLSDYNVMSNNISKYSRHNGCHNTRPNNSSNQVRPNLAFQLGNATNHDTNNGTLGENEMQVVKLVLLGAANVGKTSIIQQFVYNEFNETYTPTSEKTIYHPAVIINDHLYEVKVVDCPVISYFPINSLYEWTDYRGYGLRNATAYILVYDISSDESFQYIKSIREQILESRNMHDVPLFVVGNKQDLGSSDGRGVTRREVANIVKKQWKCGYIECSAKYNWHIVMLFKELMKSIDYIDTGHKPLMRVQDAFRRNRCVIL